jgi:hypothetical protein
VPKKDWKDRNLYKTPRTQRDQIHTPCKESKKPHIEDTLRIPVGERLQKIEHLTLLEVGRTRVLKCGECVTSYAIGTYPSSKYNKVTEYKCSKRPLEDTIVTKFMCKHIMYLFSTEKGSNDIHPYHIYGYDTEKYPIK